MQDPSHLPLQRTSGPWLDMTPLKGEVEKAIHAYSLHLGNVDTRIIITYGFECSYTGPVAKMSPSIEPSGTSADEYTFFLALRVGVVERPISRPVTMRLSESLHPRNLHFSVLCVSLSRCGCYLLATDRGDAIPVHSLRRARYLWTPCGLFEFGSATTASIIDSSPKSACGSVAIPTSIPSKTLIWPGSTAPLRHPRPINYLLVPLALT
jgi:hypothetical protein